MLFTTMQENLLDLIDNQEKQLEINSQKASSLYLRVTMTTDQDALLNIFNELFDEEKCKESYKLTLKEKIALFFYKLSFKTNKVTTC